MWFNISWMHGYDDGITRRDVIAEKMTPEQIVEAKKRAIVCVAKIIKIADSVIYEEGQVIPENCLEVLKLHRLAAEQGSAEAQCSLGKFYLDGRLIPADPMRAHKWLLLSAEQGYADGQYELGLLIHRSGQLTEEDKKDPTQAYQISLQWLNLAIQAGHSKAQFALGKMYEKGKGPPKDIKKASRVV